jgi:hypothetical protein
LITEIIFLRIFFFWRFSHKISVRVSSEWGIKWVNNASALCLGEGQDRMCLLSEAFKGEQQQAWATPATWRGCANPRAEHEVNMNFEETTTQTRLITRMIEHSIPNSSVKVWSGWKQQPLKVAALHAKWHTERQLVSKTLLAATKTGGKTIWLTLLRVRSEMEGKWPMKLRNVAYRIRTKGFPGMLVSMELTYHLRHCIKWLPTSRYGCTWTFFWQTVRDQWITFLAQLLSLPSKLSLLVS